MSDTSMDDVIALEERQASRSNWPAAQQSKAGSLMSERVLSTVCQCCVRTSLLSTGVCHPAHHAPTDRPLDNHAQFLVLCNNSFLFLQVT